jgi:hypothetical protein
MESGGAYLGLSLPRFPVYGGRETTGESVTEESERRRNALMGVPLKYLQKLLL